MVEQRRPTRPTPQAQASTSNDDLERGRQELGFLGRFFGSKENAPVFVAGLVSVMGLVGLLILVIWPGPASSGDGIKTLSGLVLSALSFLAGTATGSRR